MATSARRERAGRLRPFRTAVRVRTIGTFGSIVFTERIDRFIINGRPMVVPVAGLLEFDQSGKIRAWRDYYDWSALERQLIESGGDMSGADDA